MPWQVYREKGEFCLHKKNPDGSKGDLVHCHKTAEMARRQQAALYVSEKKELSPEDAIIIDEDNGGVEYKELAIPEETTKDYYDSMPAYASGARSFAELETERDARERVNELSQLMSDFQSIAGNIVYTPVEALDADKIHELDNAYEEFKSRAQTLIDEPIDDEGESDKATWTAAYVNSLPDSSFLYIEPGGKKDSEGKTEPRSLRHLPVKDASGKPDAAHIRNAAARANQVKLRSGGTISESLSKRLIARAQSMLKRSKKETIFDKAVNKINDIINPPPPPNMLVWKEADGDYGWMATYSNKFMDRDNPPDIIASTAHKEFVEKVDKGLAPLPDLYLWHVPEWKVGYATALAYDDSGFPIAIGRFDKECQDVAEWLAKQTDFGVSHGMWNSTIQRDPEDPSVIIAYESHEISALPRVHAANLLADWSVIPTDIKELQEVDMTIPEEKRQELLQRGLPEATLSALEERNKNKAEAATAEGIKSKETEEVQPVPEPIETPPAEEPVENKDAETSEFPTRQEVAEAVANVIGPIVTDLTAKLEEISKQLKETNDKVNEFQVSDDKRIKELIQMTPRDSLSTMMLARFERASSSKQTKIGDNDSLLKTKPTETEAPQTGGTGIPFIDKMVHDGKK